jgi:hypothetical protein
MNRITVAKTVAYLIAAIAAVSSYGHQVHLLGRALLDPLFGIIPAEWVTPVTVDSLAIVALMVRESDDVTERTKRWALLPLVLAGGLSIAANVAEAHTIVAIVVGVWTVLAYIIAELFVAKMERKAKVVETLVPRVTFTVTEAEKAARKRAGYASMSTTERAEWTRKYRARKRAVAPVSPGRVPVEELNASMAETV